MRGVFPGRVRRVFYYRKSAASTDGQWKRTSLPSLMHGSLPLSRRFVAVRLEKLSRRHSSTVSIKSVASFGLPVETSGIFAELCSFMRPHSHWRAGGI